MEKLPISGFYIGTAIDCGIGVIANGTQYKPVLGTGLSVVPSSSEMWVVDRFILVPTTNSANTTVLTAIQATKLEILLRVNGILVLGAQAASVFIGLTHVTHENGPIGVPISAMIGAGDTVEILYINYSGIDVLVRPSFRRHRFHASVKENYSRGDIAAWCAQHFVGG